MDSLEKRRLKAEISEYIDLSNGRFTDAEVERLYEIVANRFSYDGKERTRRTSYKTFDSEDTYRVEQIDTYRFHCDNGIYIEHLTEKHWDDGQDDVFRSIYSTAREILNNLHYVGL